jgi:hypothetical protein
MPADRPLRNLTRERLLGVYEELQTEPASKKYNLRKELQGDKREAAIYANRWVTRDQYLELTRQEIVERGLALPGAAAEPTPEPEATPGAQAGAVIAADAGAAEGTESA